MKGTIQLRASQSAMWGGSDAHSQASWSSTTCGSLISMDIWLSIGDLQLSLDFHGTPKIMLIQLESLSTLLLPSRSQEQNTRSLLEKRTSTCLVDCRHKLLRVWRRLLDTAHRRVCQLMPAFRPVTMDSSRRITMDTCSCELRRVMHTILDSVLLSGFFILLAFLCGPDLSRSCQFGRF